MLSIYSLFPNAIVSKGLPSDAAGTAVLELPVVMHIASLPTRKALEILFMYIYIYGYMHVFIFQYINVTEMNEKKKKALHVLCCSTKSYLLQKLHPYITRAGHVNT